MTRFQPTASLHFAVGKCQRARRFVSIEAYLGWIRRFIRFHDRKHPNQLSDAAIAEFLSSLAINQNVSASTQNRALSALLFLYQEVLHRKLEHMDVIHARRPRPLPVVMSREEVEVLLSQIRGVCRTMALILYGSGLRLQECVSLRVKDVDSGNHLLMVRRGKGDKAYHHALHPRRWPRSVRRIEPPRSALAPE